MPEKHSDEPSEVDRDDVERSEGSVDSNGSRRYWSASDASNGSTLPHWTEPPTGEIPKIYGLSRDTAEEIDHEKADEGAISWKRDRRKLETSESVGSLSGRRKNDTSGRHFAKDETESVLDLDPASPEKNSGTGRLRDQKPQSSVRVISSRPSPLRSRYSKSRSANSSSDPVTAEIFASQGSGSSSELPSGAKESGSKMDDPPELVLPTSRRPQWKRSRPVSDKEIPENGVPGVARGKRKRYSESTSVTTRVITGLLLGAGTVFAFLLGRPAVLAILTAVVVLSVVEYFRLVRQDHDSSPKGGYRPAVLVGLIGTVGEIFGAYLKGPGAIVFVLSFTMLASFLWYLTGVLKAPVLPNAAVTFTAVAWIGLGGAFAALIIRPVPGGPRQGLAYMMAVMISVVAADVFAYFGGLIFGKRKLAPSISPRKTIEGLMIGALGAILAGALISSHIHPISVSLGGMIGLLAALGVPCGDLLESKIKREIGAKDTGSILPGHGGFLDRIDGLIFVTPLVYYLLYFGHHIA